MNIYEQIEKMVKGDYKFSLMVSYINTKQNYYLNDFADDIKEEIFEYKLNHLIKVTEDNYTLNINDKEYYFPEIDLFSYDVKVQNNKNDSGTNMLYFFIKMENLSKNFDDIVITQKTYT